LQNRTTKFDKINTLKWINTQLPSFGGAPSNITAVGVSAGSASIHMYIHSHQGPLRSSDYDVRLGPTLGPLLCAVYEREWKGRVEKSGIPGEVSVLERVERMRGIDIDVLIRNDSRAAMGPVGHGVVLPEEWGLWDGSGGVSRCKEIILGNTNVEALMLDT
jgi:hypothetical protein